MGNRQQLEQILYENYPDIEISKNEHIQDDVVVDYVISKPHSEKKFFVYFKDIDPAGLDDVVKMHYLKIVLNEKKDKKYEYGIYCGVGDNTAAEDAATNEAKIQYHKTFDSLVEGIKKYFSQ